MKATDKAVLAAQPAGCAARSTAYFHELRSTKGRCRRTARQQPRLSLGGNGVVDCGIRLYARSRGWRGTVSLAVGDDGRREVK